MGRLVRDPETHLTTSGVKYSRFTVAVDRPMSGENKQADFIPVVVWRTTADFVETYIKKGALVSIEGEFTSSTFENQEGKKVTRYEVTGSRLQSLGGKSQADNASESHQEKPAQPKPKVNESVFQGLDL